MQTILDQVQQELDALCELGVRVPKRAYTAMTEDEAQEHWDKGMSITEIADLAISLSL